MLNFLARNWWSLALRGLLAVIFGLTALIWPELTVDVLVLLFGAFALANGIFAVIAAFRGQKIYAHWWLLLLEGGVGILLGLATMIWPEATEVVLLLFIAAWALGIGILQIMAAIMLRRELSGEGLLILSGVLSIVFGVLLAVQPRAGAISLIWLIGAYALIVGALMIVLAFQLRGEFRAVREVFSEEVLDG